MESASEYPDSSYYFYITLHKVSSDLPSRPTLASLFESIHAREKDGWMKGLMDRWKKKWMDGKMDLWMKRWMDEKRDGWKKGQIKRWMDG